MKENKIEIDMTSEPSGSYRILKLNKNELNQLVEAIDDMDNFFDSEIFNSIHWGYVSSVIGGIHGISIDVEKISEILPKGSTYKKNNTISLPYDDNFIIPDGCYVVYSCPTKMNLYINMDTPDGEAYDPSALEIIYTEVDLCEFEDEYGEIQLNIIEDVMYKGKQLVENVLDCISDQEAYYNMTVFNVEQGIETEIIKIERGELVNLACTK